MADIPDAAVSDDGNTELTRELRHSVDGSRLRATDSHDLLGDTDRARTHANPKTVRASSDEACRLLACNDIAGDDLELREGLLDPLDHLNLVDRVALGGVENDDVQTGLNKKREAVAVCGARPDSSSGIELLALGKLRREGIRLVLEEVRASEERREAPILVHDGKLALLGVAKDIVRFLESDALRSGNEVGGHDFVQRR